jgi:FAD/FMN-containing dehydrogenase
LSIWTHNLKGTEYIPTYSVARYTGKAVKYAAGIMSYELAPLGLKHNITLITPGGSTVGAAGGFIQGGGHSGLTSYYGLASDHLLSVNLVTADGRFITVDPTQNTELYWAIRGGGGGTSFTTLKIP